MSFDEIEWFENGKKIEIDKKLAKNWKFFGLCNTYFVKTESYKGMADILKGE